MSKLRRYHTAGNWYFISCVTYLRHPILTEHADLLTSAIATARTRLEHEVHACVIMPDHFHLVVESKGADISKVMQRIKMGFAANWRRREGVRRGRVWQHRFWDHIIRDQNDLNHHIDYVHYNPVKHGFVLSPFEWEHSSIHAYLIEGIYDRDWVRRDPPHFDGDFGE